MLGGWSAGLLSPRPQVEWDVTVERWVTRDFMQRDYARVNGKPLILIADSIRFDEQWGGRDGQAYRSTRRASRRFSRAGIRVRGTGTNVPTARGRYRFGRWEGCVSDVQTCTFVVERSRRVAATFTRR